MKTKGIKWKEKMKAINVFVTILLVSVVLGLLVGVSGATWCDTDFAKRVNVSVNNTAGSALTDYQVYVNLSTNPINETSLKVYNSTSCTLRSHWTENETGGNSYGVWINYSAIAASTWTNNTAIYYENAAASSASDGTNTFEFFDDFETEGGGEWTKYSGNPVFTNSSGSERFDSGYVGVPQVIKVGSEYWMYYLGGREPNQVKRDNIGLAISTDLANWTRWDGDQTNNAIIYSGGVGDFDENRAWQEGNVIRESATSWKIWYLGDSDTGDNHVGRVGYATSTNGKNWTKYSGSGYGNSIFEDMTTSAKGIGSFTVIKEGDTDYKMIYGSFTSSYDITNIKYATSSDGINWTIQNGGTPVISGTYLTIDTMINISGTYYLWVSDSSYTTIRLFTSTDLISWTNKGVQISIGGTGEWDSNALYGCGVFENTSGVWRMMYHAHEGTTHKIGYATLEKTLPIVVSAFSQFGTSGTPTITNGEADLGSGDYILSTQTFNAPIVTEMRIRQTATDVIGRMGLYDKYAWTDSSGYIGYQLYTGSLYTNFETDQVLRQAHDTNNHTYKTIWNTSTTADFYIDGTLLGNGSGSAITNRQLWIGAETAHMYCDWMFSRKYAAAEPTVTLGSEEEGPSSTPVISNVANGSISSTSQYINWTVNQTAHNRILYSNESDLTPAYYSSWDNSTAAPNITLSGLDASTQYWYQVWSYNTTNTSLSDNSSTLSFTTAAADSSFTVTLPSGYTHLKFEPSNSTAQNLTPNGQTDSQEFYNVTNTGDITLDIRLQLNETVLNIELKADNDNNPIGAKEVNTTLVTVCVGLAPSNSADIWLWSDFSHAVEQSTNKTINISVVDQLIF